MLAKDRLSWLCSSISLITCAFRPPYSWLQCCRLRLLHRWVLSLSLLTPNQSAVPLKMEQTFTNFTFLSISYSCLNTKHLLPLVSPLNSCGLTIVQSFTFGLRPVKNKNKKTRSLFLENKSCVFLSISKSKRVHQSSRVTGVKM